MNIVSNLGESVNEVNKTIQTSKDLMDSQKNSLNNSLDSSFWEPSYKPTPSTPRPTSSDSRPTQTNTPSETNKTSQTLKANNYTPAIALLILSFIVIAGFSTAIHFTPFKTHPKTKFAEICGLILVGFGLFAGSIFLFIDPPQVTIGYSSSSSTVTNNSTTDSA